MMAGLKKIFSRYGEHGMFLKPALLNFPNRHLIQFFKKHGLCMVTDENGKVFLKTRRSADVLALLLLICNDCGVSLHTGEPVTGVVSTNKSFEITTGRAVYRSTYLVIATGGASYPATGSTGDGYRLAAGMGHAITEIAPALTPLSITEFPFADLFLDVVFRDAIFRLAGRIKDVLKRQGI